MAAIGGFSPETLAKLAALRREILEERCVSISNEFAAEIVAKMRARIESRDELTAETSVDERDLLLIKIYDDLQALTKATSFLGGGIPAVRKVSG